MPAFYLRPQSVAELVDASVARVLDLLELPHQLSERWNGQVPPASAGL
jgi:4-hydroxy-3-polyprenylbenzoate decarboxylase